MNRLTEAQLQDLQKDVLRVINKVDSLKYNMANHDQRQLTNHLQFAMTTLRNMATIQQVERTDPNGFNTQAAMSGPKVQYNPDGTTKIVRAVGTTGEGWEAQFDESMLMNPPCYVMPPSGVTDIARLRKAGPAQRMAGL